MAMNSLRSLLTYKLSSEIYMLLFLLNEIYIKTYQNVKLLFITVIKKNKE